MSADPIGLRPSLELSIDTASELASLALSSRGRLLAELTWHAGRDHSRQLIPAIEALLARQDASKDDLAAIFVCTGPGGYAGLRAGVSTAKALAFALSVPIVGIGRLEIEAYAFAAAGLPAAAVHRAGRRELAFAVYTSDPDWREIAPPQLASAEWLMRALPDNALVTGEVDAALGEALVARSHRVASGAPSLRHAALLAEIGWRRLQSGRSDDPKSLVPLYLREPAIGPQT